MLHAAAGNDSEMPPARRQKSVFWQAALSLRWTSHRWLGHGAPERLLLIVEFLCSSTSGLTFSHVTQHRGREAGILWTGRLFKKVKRGKAFFPNFIVQFKLLSGQRLIMRFKNKTKNTYSIKVYI